MSDSYDKQLAALSEPLRNRRMVQVLADLQRVYRLREEGMSMPDIAKRLGWSLSTLYAWLDAAKVMERKGIRMTKNSKL